MHHVGKREIACRLQAFRSCRALVYIIGLLPCRINQALGGWRVQLSKRGLRAAAAYHTSLRLFFLKIADCLGSFSALTFASSKLSRMPCVATNVCLQSHCSILVPDLSPVWSVNRPLEDHLVDGPLETGRPNLNMECSGKGNGVPWQGDEHNKFARIKS